MAANKEMEPRRAAALERTLAKAECYYASTKAKREADDAWFDAAVIAWASSDEKRDAELEDNGNKKDSDIEGAICVVVTLGGFLGSWAYCLYFGYAPVYVAVVSVLLFYLLKMVLIFVPALCFAVAMTWLFNVLSGK